MTMFTLGAFAIIFDELGRVLLNQRRDNQRWNLPGGRVEIGEMPDETVVRETFEETGLLVEIVRFVGFYGKEGPSDFVFVFLCDPVGGQLRPITSETLDCRFFALKEIPVEINAYHLWRINDAVKTSASPVFVRQSPQLGEHIVQTFRNTYSHEP